MSGALRLRNEQELAALRYRDRVDVTRSLGLRFELQRELKSPNTMLGRHWRTKHFERKQWQVAITAALVHCYGPAIARTWLTAESGLANCSGRCDHRMLVLVARLAPSKRRFIRDDDNLRFAVKPLLDALKNLGLIHDDKREWIDLPPPEQGVSTDRTFWTLVTLEPIREGQR